VCVRDILLKAEKTTNVERKRKTTMQQQPQYQQQRSESAQGDNNNKDNKNIDKDDYLPYLLSMEGRSKYL